MTNQQNNTNDQKSDFSGCSGISAFLRIIGLILSGVAWIGAKHTPAEYLCAGAIFLIIVVAVLYWTSPYSS
jgi:hypothetical protein